MARKAGRKAAVKSVRKTAKKAATKSVKKDFGHAEHSRKADELGIVEGVQRPLKIVFLGAGSMFFQKLFVDVLNIPGADRGEMAIVDIDTKRLKLAKRLGYKVLERMGKGGWTLTASTDRRKVLGGAHYIINCIEVSGVETVRFDNDIPLKYGVDQCIGDTGGPGGLFKALRTVPVFLEVLKDVEALCPRAWVLNYTNPMSIMCLAAARASSANVIGLCHSVQGAARALANIAGVPYEQVKWKCAGVNHLAWVTELTRDGEDIYPLVFKKVRSDPATYDLTPIRFDMMLHFGYFVTESAGHFSEYVPYYRKRPDLIQKYCRERYKGESGFYSRNWPTWRKNCDEHRRKQIAGAAEISAERTWEYASYIIQAMETNAPFVIHATVPNTGLIDNLPSDGVVEVACVVNRHGIAPTHYGKLPPHCAALCDWNMRMYDLAATACIEKSREAAAFALMLDPLTAACCCPAEIKQMTEELFEAEKDFLPGF
ncbi:MAG TPA: alpha-glucosidase/alpha-galactosidase [Phycisphaerae bacterium]|nr:alpha-glucosidase/alpha-galactosidase [Phycisphaerae bacterium]